VELVQDEEPEPPRRLDELLLVRPGQEELEHDVVREEDVGRRRDDLVADLVLVLPSVPAERDRRLALGVAPAKELLELADLGVRERVHGVDHDGLEPLAELEHVHGDHPSPPAGPAAASRSV
jgi:hypothetical protein